MSSLTDHNDRLSAADYYERVGCHYVANRIRHCCQTHILFREPNTSEIHVLPAFCNSQFCPTCNRRRRAARIAELQAIFDHYNLATLRFVTITRKSAPHEPLPKAAYHMRKSLNRLRARKWWRERVKGYYLKFEIEYNRKADSWHFHAHFITLSGFLKKRELKEEWRQASRGSYIVDIKACNEKAKFELSKYVTKFHNVPDAQMPILIEYLTSHRMSAFAGAFRPFIALARLSDEKPNWEYIGSITSFISHLDPAYVFRSDFLIALMLWINREEYPDISYIPELDLAYYLWAAVQTNPILSDLLPDGVYQELRSFHD